MGYFLCQLTWTWNKALIFVIIFMVCYSVESVAVIVIYDGWGRVNCIGPSTVGPTKHRTGPKKY